MAKARVFERCFSAIKSFRVISLPECRLQTTQEVKYLEGKGGTGTTVPRCRVGLIWRCAGRAFTWTSVRNHPAPLWIISTIITRLKTRVCADLAHDAVKDNRCCWCLEGTEIKDYFSVWSFLQARESPPLFCQAWRGVCAGGSFSSGLAVLGMGCLSESEYCLIWESWCVLEISGHAVST